VCNVIDNNIQAVVIIDLSSIIENKALWNITDLLRTHALSLLLICEKEVKNSFS